MTMGEFEDDDSMLDGGESPRAMLFGSETSSKSCVQVSHIPNAVDADRPIDAADCKVTLTNGHVQSAERDGVGRDENESTALDGGWRAWTIMLGSFLCNGILLGIINSYSVVYFYLVKQLEEAGDTESSSKVALVGSLTFGAMFFVSPVAGILIDRIGIRLTTFVGGLLASSGMFVSSYLARNVDLLFVTYGLMYGVGASLAYTPSLVILGHYFERYLGIANGFVTSGSSVFTVFMPMLLDALIATWGLATSLRVVSLLVACVMLCAFLFKSPPPPAASRAPEKKAAAAAADILNTDIWRNRKYVVWTSAISVALFGYFVPYVHMYRFVKLKFPTSDGKLPVMAIGVTSGVGRLVFGYVADSPRVDRILLQQIAFVSIGLLTVLTPLTAHFEVLIFFSLVLGLFDGCFISILGPIAFDLCGKDGASQAIGFLLGFCSIPLTVGPPIAALLFDRTGSYLLPFLLAGVPPFVGAAAMCLVRYVGNPSVGGGDGGDGGDGERAETKDSADQHTEPLVNRTFRRSVSMHEVVLASSESLTDGCADIVGDQRIRS